MSDDLVKRLRNTAKWLRLQNEDSRGIYFDRAPFEAADRISELEAALRKLYAHEGERVLNSIGIECYTEELEAALDEARAALAGGKEDEATPSA